MSSNSSEESKTSLQEEEECESLKKDLDYSSLSDFDEFKKHLGDLGWYHGVVVIVCLLSGLNSVFYFVIIQYFMAKPTIFWCTSLKNGIALNNTIFQSSSNDSDLERASKDMCRDYGDSCATWAYSSEGMALAKTVVTDFNLYCSSSVLFAFVTSSYFIGVALGVPFCGSWADKFGRRRMAVITTAVAFFSHAVLSILPNLWLFIIFRAINGFATIGAFTVAYIEAVELMSPKYRAVIMSTSSAFCNIFRIWSACLGLMLSDWRWVNLVGTLVDLPILILIILIMPESPRWLLKSGKKKEALEVLQKIARVSGKKLRHIDIDSVVIEEENRGQFLDLFTKKNTRIKTFEQMYNWFVIALVFWAIYLNTGKYIVPGLKPQLVLIIFSAFGLCCTSWTTGVLTNLLGRRFVHALVTLIAACALFAAPFVDDSVKIIAGLVGIMGISIAFNTIYIRTSELFPTVTRNLGIGLCSSMGRFGAIVFPFIDLSEASLIWLPSVLYATLAVGAAILALHLPETLGHVLPETIDEAEAVKQGYHHSFPFWKKKSNSTNSIIEAEKA